MSEESTKLKKDQRKESILDTALKVMSEKGIEATTMREIAKAEGISETLLYRFFKNKQEVFLAIIQTRAEKTYQNLEELAETIRGMIPDPRVTLPLIWKLVKKRLLENRDLISLMGKERAKLREQFKDLKPFGRKIIENFQKLQFESTLTDYFKRCQDEGNLRKDVDPKHVTRMFLGLMGPPAIPRFPFSRKPMHGIDEAILEEFIQAQIEILLNGIVPNKTK